MKKQQINWENKHCIEASSFGYTVLKGVFDREDIARIAHDFDKHFVDKLNKKQIQHRNFRRFTCKVPICATYEAILNNKKIDKFLTQLLGENYVLYNFSSHVALPGAAQQVMHIDGCDPLNSETFVDQSPAHVYLHIPLIDMQREHGATELWSATYYRESDDMDCKWVSENIRKSDPNLSRGDVVVKLTNCIHAGGENNSEDRRDILTLIYAREFCYGQGGTGKVVCGFYNDRTVAQLPYRIASQTSSEFVSETAEYIAQNFQANLPVNDMKEHMLHYQYRNFKDALPNKLFDKLKVAPANFISDANEVFNLVDYLLPIVKACFKGREYKLHSVKLNTEKRGLACDDPTFIKYKGQRVLNKKENQICIHIPLEESKDWISLYPGNKILSMRVIENSPCCEDFEKNIGSENRSMLVTSGAMVYARTNAVPTIELTFCDEEHVPSYDDSYRVLDVFALSLPDYLGSVVRYTNIYITKDEFKNFKFNKWRYLDYRIMNYMACMEIKSPIMAKVLDPFCKTFSFFLKKLYHGFYKESNLLRQLRNS